MFYIVVSVARYEKEFVITEKSRTFAKCFSNNINYIIELNKQK